MLVTEDDRDLEQVYKRRQRSDIEMLVSEDDRDL